MANPTDMFTEEELQQGIRNLEAIRQLCSIIRDGMTTLDPMRIHFFEVIKWCNQKIAENQKMMARGPSDKPEPSRIILATDPNRFLK